MKFPEIKMRTHTDTHLIMPSFSLSNNIVFFSFRVRVHRVVAGMFAFALLAQFK